MEQHTGLDEILTPTDEERVEPTAEAPPAEQSERPRDEHGRFVAKDTGGEAEQPPTAAEEPPAAPPAAEQPRMVPLAAHEDERRKRQDLERRLQQLEASIQRQEPVQIPDPILEPNEFASFQQQHFNQQLLNTKLDISEEMARSAHGDETVDAARDWGLAQFETNPAFRAEVLGQRNPYGYLVQQHKRQSLASELEGVGSLEDLKAKLRAEIEAEIRASLPSTVTAPPTTAGTRSVGARSGPEWAGPTPLNAIISTG